jgi:hypothetical protein
MSGIMEFTGPRILSNLQLFIEKLTAGMKKLTRFIAAKKDFCTGPKNVAILMGHKVYISASNRNHSPL